MSQDKPKLTLSQLISKLKELEPTYADLPVDLEGCDCFNAAVDVEFRYQQTRNPISDRWENTDKVVSVYVRADVP